MYTTRSGLIPSAGVMGRSLALAILLPAAAACVGGSTDAAQAERAQGVTAIVGGLVYPAPDAAPIANGVVLIEGERIAAMGARDAVEIPRGATRIDAGGGAVLAAFWNSHVHLFEPRWQGSDTLAAGAIESLLREMYTRYGFAHVVDIGSLPGVTLPLRQRVRAGEIAGPDIRTALIPFVPPNGTPRYIEPLVLPELRSAQDARDSVRARVTQGADGIKLFTMPITRRTPFPVMDATVVQAVAEAAHAAGRFVVAHPTDLPGVRVAVENGVDVLAHTTPESGPLPDALLREMVDRQMALVPTLTLWELDVAGDSATIRAFVSAAQEQVSAFAGLGGRILFGTDAGYIPAYDPAREFELMAGAGLDARAILTSLTTAPAARFGAADRTGQLGAGYDADIVIVDGDPWQDLRALTRVRLTMKRGRVLYEAPTRER
ncbi:MAG TPA: amidohydrolase family protein [Gemmatimonadaceae bacterium]